MKKIFTSIGISLVAVAVVLGAGGTGYTGAPSPQVATVTLTPNTVAPVITNNVEVVGVQLVTTSGTGTAKFYDCPSTADPYYGTNYVTGEYTSTAGYNTNMVTSYVGYNGYTNWYTNAGYFTYTVTNAAATNELTPKGVLPLIGGTVTSGNNAMLFNQGIMVLAPTITRTTSPI